LIDIELARNEKEILLEEIIKRIIQATPIIKSSGISLVGGAPVSSLRAAVEDLESEKKKSERVRKNVRADLDNGLLKTTIRQGHEFVKLWDLVIWLDHYGRIARQAAYPGQPSYIEECYEKIRKGSAQEAKKPSPTEIWRKNQILDALAKAKYIATKLPVHEKGKPGVRNEIWKKMGWKPEERLPFNKAWQELRDKGSIADATQ
jgi:hypothetical protein